jgi:hypothetical protein
MPITCGIVERRFYLYPHPRISGAPGVGRARAAAVALCIALTALTLAYLLHLTLDNLRRLREVPPLSWDTVALVWSYVFAFTTATVLLLAAVCVILAAAEALGDRDSGGYFLPVTTPSSAARPPS